MIEQVVDEADVLALLLLVTSHIEVVYYFSRFFVMQYLDERATRGLQSRLIQH